MSIDDYLGLIRDFYGTRGIEVSSDALGAFQNDDYWSEELLGTMETAEAIRNVRIVLEDTVAVRELSDSPRIEQEHVVSVLQRYFCQLPPFCRRR